MLSNIRYVLLTATRDRLFFGLLAGILSAAYISSVLGSTAMLEQEQMTIAFTAASARVIIMVGIIVFIGFHMRNAFDAREIDVLLSRPVSRSSLVLSYWVGFSVVVSLLVVPTILLVAIIGTLNHTGFLLWSLSLLLESWLVVSIALFAALTIKSGVGTVLASMAIYTLSRMMGFFIATTNSGSIFKEHEINLGAQWLMKGIALVVPRLDFYAKSNWLIYGAKSYEDLYLVLMQSAVFIPLLIAASVIDFKRKQF
jgi:ABC-type transport system involved in multi-copper enzyme maturation permease subunit